MATYYDELHALLAKNNRQFKTINAGSSYWSILKAGYNEDLAFKSAYLLDQLQVSAQNSDTKFVTSQIPL